MPANPERVAAFVREFLDRDGISADDLPVEQGPVLRPSGGSPLALPALAPSDQDLVRKIERGQPLTPQEAVRVESIVIPNGLRPAFDVLRDSYPDLPIAWNRLNERRADMVPRIRGIGRVDLAGHPKLVFAGTGFVVGPDVLLTNRHVAELFTDGTGDGPALHFKPGISASVDLKQEVATSDSIRLTVTEPVVVLETWDAAILRVSGVPADIEPLPLSGASIPSLDNRLAVVVGYPFIDDRSDLVQQLNIFRGVFFKKRLMPGRLTGLRPAPSFGRTVTALAHDCTTVGGNSGSALIDVESGLVVGVHFFGEHLISNYAVPSWELAADARVAGAGVHFA